MASCTNHPAVNQGILRCTRCGRPFCPSCVIRLRGFVYCASCKGEQVRDIQSGSVAGELELASVGRRFGAMWIDSVVFACIAGGSAALVIPALARASQTAGPNAEPPAALMMVMIVAFVGLVVVYEGLMLQTRGQTLGKMALGIKVVTPEGKDIGAGQAWGRAVMRQVFFSYLSLIDILPALFTKQRTCLHDMIAKTRVIRVRT
jgi:uncharacterized RDD family membrane protein YckC